MVDTAEVTVLTGMGLGADICTGIVLTLGTAGEDEPSVMQCLVQDVTVHDVRSGGGGKLMRDTRDHRVFRAHTFSL